MIIGVGCDIVEHELTLKLGWDKKPEMLRRVFSEKEAEQLTSIQTVRFISGRFAAKEAILKSLGTAMKDGISLTDIQIFQGHDGRPIADLSGTVKVIANNLGVVSLHLSISHSEKFSIAYVIAEGAIDLQN